MIKWTSTEKGKYWYGKRNGFAVQRMGYPAKQDRPWTLTIMLYGRKKATVYKHFATEGEADQYVSDLLTGKIRLLVA